jgi:hypothetical protein
MEITMRRLFAPLRRARKLAAIAVGTCVTITLALALWNAEPSTILGADTAYALFAALVIATYIFRTRPTMPVSTPDPSGE